MKDGIPSGKTLEDVVAGVRKEAYSLRSKSANDDPNDDAEDALNTSISSLTSSSARSSPPSSSFSSSSSPVVNQANLLTQRIRLVDPVAPSPTSTLLPTLETMDLPSSPYFNRLLSFYLGDIFILFTDLDK